MAAITSIKARQIFDSRGNPTVEVRPLFRFDTFEVSLISPIYLSSISRC